MSRRTGITSAGKGGVDVRLPQDLRDLLRSLAHQLVELIDDPESQQDPGMARLFPPASMDDPLEALGFEQLMGESLRNQKRAAAATLESTADAKHLDAEGALAWMRSLNDIRLLVGTRLDVQEDTDVEALFRDPLTEQAALVYLATTELVEMLSQAMDPV